MYWTNAIPAYKIQCANLDGTNVKDLITVTSWPESLALDISGGKMYWTLWTTGKIQRANLDGTNIEDLVTGENGLRSPSDLVLDVSGGKMYWTESYWGKIQRANLDGTNIEDLVRLSLERVSTNTRWVGLDAIALDVSHGKMYWTHSINKKIQRANLDGSNVQDLVTTGLINPNGITLDVSGGKMYWTDVGNLVGAGTGKGKIQRANLDGSNVEDLVTNLSYPEDIKLHIPTDVEITESPIYLREDVNRDSLVNILDLVLVANDFGQSGEKITDINDDNTVNILDLVLVAGAFGKSATAPALYAKGFSMLTAADVKLWLSQAQQINLTDAKSLRGVQFLQQLLEALTPKKTALLPNYPNPFNPETWIPYHLAKDAKVTLHIYAMNGTLVRTLTLGYQAAGMYQNRSSAAYWDGKNAFGEAMASGVYFYKLTAGDFSATRKMLIMK